MEDTCHIASRQTVELKFYTKPPSPFNVYLVVGRGGAEVNSTYFTGTIWGTSVYPTLSRSALVAEPSSNRDKTKHPDTTS